MRNRNALTALALGILLLGGVLSSNRVQQQAGQAGPGTISLGLLVETTPLQAASPSSTRSPTSSCCPQASQTPSPRPSRTPFHAASNTATAARTPMPWPTSTPLPSATLLPEAKIEGIFGFGQLLPLSCESRSAADWARYFKFEIRELELMERIPRSDDPEVGFVGSPFGSWGQIPPNPYGVHAGPVAAALRSYGLQAEARRNMTWHQLRAEIASGRPVVVWVVGHVEAGKGVQMDIGGKTRTVARYEHTVIAIGYDSKHITILDGKQVYKRPVDVFLESWKALENMAITWNPGAPREPLQAK